MINLSFPNLFKKEVVKQSFISAFGNIVTGILAGIGFIFISRKLGPASFGVFSVSVSLIIVLSKIADFGLSAAITKFLPLYREKQTASDALVKHVLWLKLLLVTATLIGVIVLNKQLSLLINFGTPTHWYLIALGTASVVFFEFIQVVLSANHLFTNFSLYNISQSFFKLFFYIILGLFGILNPFFYILFYSLSPIISSFTIYGEIQKLIYKKPEFTKKLNSQIIKFSAHSGVGIISSSLIINIDSIFVQKFTTPYEVGIYSGISRVVQFVFLVGIALTNVISNRVSRYNDRRQQKLFLKKTILYTFVVFCLFLLFSLVYKKVLTIVLGGEYTNASDIFYILGASSFIYLATIPIFSFFFTLNVSWYFSLGGIIQLLVIITLSTVFVPNYGSIASAYSRLIASAINYAYTLFVIWIFWLNNHHKKINN